MNQKWLVIECDKSRNVDNTQAYHKTKIISSETWFISETAKKFNIDAFIFLITET